MPQFFRTLSAIGHMLLAFVSADPPLPAKLNQWLGIAQADPQPAPATYIVFATHTHPATDSICIKRGPLLATRSRGPFCQEKVLGALTASNEEHARKIARAQPFLWSQWSRGLIFVHSSMVSAADVATAWTLTEQSTRQRHSD